MLQNSIKDKFLFVFKTLLEQGIFLLIPIIIIRLFDLFLFKEALFISYFELLKTFPLIIIAELKVIFVYLLTIGLLLTLLKSWSKILYWIISIIFTLLVFFIYLSTIQYYHTANIRLDHVILFFTLDELKHIALSETGNLVGQYLWFYILPILCLTLLLLFHNKIIKLCLQSMVVKLIVLILILAIGSNYLIYKNKLNENGKELVSSKTFFLFHSIYANYNNKNRLKNISNTNHIAAVKSFREFMNWEGMPYQFEYPLIKKFNLKNGDLSNYFNAFDGKPNLVMVFCEGESSVFSGPNARYGSLTPHLDSIYAKSLFWPNTVSNTDRTHGIFSNALASLPQGFERGILNIRTQFPNHLSIPKILVNNGYISTFTYGGWAYFDNYEPFLKINYVQNIHDNQFFKEKGIISDKKTDKAFSWGVPDKKLFSIYFDLKKENNQHPFFDILLNLSLHSPYNVPNQDYFYALSKERFDLVNGDQKLYNDYKKVLASITYQDEAIGEFMNEYKKRDDYENTIFLFVGDHNVRELPMLSILEGHHVPLAIFSPKLKQAIQFDDIVSQSDIPQSILTIIGPYLDKNQMPKFNSWIGDGLTTNNITKSVKPIFLGSVNGDMIGVLNKDTLLLDGVLYKIKKDLIITKIDSETRKKYYAKELQNYRIINSYVIIKQKLLTSSDNQLYPNHKADFYFSDN